jgi:hypothetical protein
MSDLELIKDFGRDTTLHLLDSPANAKRLAEATAEADAGLARELTPEQLRDARPRRAQKLSNEQPNENATSSFL